MNFKKLFSILLCFGMFSVFAQVQDRDVPYTKNLLKFIDAYFDHRITSTENAENYYLDAVEDCPASYTEYQKETHLSRCDYYFGMYIIETYDLTELEHALDDTSKEFVDPVERNRLIKAEAAVWFDSSIEHAQKAMKMNPDTASDAMIIYTQALSANCTVRTVGYVLSNGLKIGSTAKKALKFDPKNGTGNFSSHAQDVYAPGIFGNAVRGRKMMLSYLEDPEMICEKFDRFNFTCAIAYTYYRQNKFEDAVVWYKKCLDIYPGNFPVNNLVKRCEEKISEK